MIIDSHCHLTWPDYDNDREQVMAKMAELGVGCINIGTNPDIAKQVVAFTAQHENMWCAIGLYPSLLLGQPVLLTENREKQFEKFDADIYEKLLTDKVVAIGECGLDFAAWPVMASDEQKEKWESQQNEALLAQIKFAQKHNLSVVIHCRGQYEKLFEIFESARAWWTTTAILHCFTGTLAEAQAGLEFGCYLSFSGILTFKSGASLREVAKNLPLDKILVETDAPYLAPEPYRGQRCDPTMVLETAKILIDILGLPQDKLFTQLLANTKRAFNLTF